MYNEYSTIQTIVKTNLMSVKFWITELITEINRVIIYGREFAQTHIIIILIMIQLNVVKILLTRLIFN